ncbi:MULTISPECIES: hypothetical protein [Pseudoalteromonas]|uniref:Uncharacterized protein n=1 Tax=Pseudoalteromonas rubra TaxID=43658 RepID=A0A8T0C3D4_9GAMM|nr:MULTISPECIES: hypothetical protein [Pseudoalteromonas]KAF7783821.1 hypothetical protein PRUB_a5131 [Pseudoalteromonas rubra]MCG7564603.1 hypothetical protein [Pseudoalteromonas sp. McH1-42]MEC4091002.1 hypothetical protein [Pseudoalteromonas rubra]
MLKLKTKKLKELTNKEIKDNRQTKFIAGGTDTHSITQVGFINPKNITG